MLNYLVEFVGTFIFLCGILIALKKTNNSLACALLIGMVLAGVIFLGGSISGGNYNPAISIVMYTEGVLPLETTIIYVLVQVLGGLCALHFCRAIVK